MLGFVWDCPSGVRPLLSSQVTTWIWLLHGKMFWWVGLVSSLTVCCVQMHWIVWHTDLKWDTQGWWGVNSPWSGLSFPSRWLFFPTATLIFPSLIDCFSLLQISGFVSRVGEEEIILLPDKEQHGTCGSLTALFVRHWNCWQKPSVGSMANLTQAVNWKRSTSFILEAKNVSNTPAYYCVT